MPVLRGVRILGRRSYKGLNHYLCIPFWGLLLILIIIAIIMIMVIIVIVIIVIVIIIIDCNYNKEPLK